MTLDKYIYEIKQMLPDEGKYLDDRLIKRWIDLTRITWMKNEYNKNNSLDSSFSQSIYLELQPYDQSLISIIPTSSRILRSTEKLPELLETTSTDGLISVRNAKILSEKYNIVNREQAVYCGNGKLNRGDIFVFIDGDYLYVKLQRANPKIAMLTHLLVDGYFTTPEDVTEYDDLSGTTCYNILTQEYPINDTLWVYMREQIINNGLTAIQANKLEDNAEGKK